MARRQTVMLEMGGVCDAQGNLTLDANPLRPNKLFCIQLVSVKSPTKGGVDVNIELVKGSTVRGVHCLVIEDEDKYFSYRPNIWIPSEWTLRLVWSGSSSGRQCLAWVYGYLMDD